MKSINLSLGFVVAVSFAALLGTGIVTVSYGALKDVSMKYPQPRTSIALSGNNVYLTWWDNKTGNNEVFLARSTDNGKTFDTPINLSNAKGASADSQIAVAQNNVYVTWNVRLEFGKCSQEQVLMVERHSPTELC